MGETVGDRALYVVVVAGWNLLAGYRVGDVSISISIARDIGRERKWSKSTQCILWYSTCNLEGC